MATTRDIRRRIKSVKSTAQITKAMQLVAASKMKKAQDQALSGRHYAELMNKVLVNLQEQADDDSHALLEERGEGKELVILVSTDKGLCGGLNTNLLKAVFSEHPNASYVTVGSKGRQAVARMKGDLLADFHVTDPVDFAQVKTVSHFVREKFLEGEFSKVTVAFTNFVNTLSQVPCVETLLPVSPVTLGKAKGYEGVGAESDADAGEVPDAGYEFEPNASAVLDSIVPQYVDYQIYQMVLESRASEHSARMVAMKSATDNAEQLIKDLSLEYNKLRQAAITNELLEITTASLALE
jgi:F-type H+-transporting ATPase subunit gamma